MSISQYMPLDIFNAGGDPTNTTPAQVKAALQKYEDDFVNEVLLGELQIPPAKLPVLHIGEYGMGIRGLVAPNVWDASSWIAAGQGDLLLSDDLQKKHAAIAMKGVIQYIKSPTTRFRSFLLWMGGKPYDVLGINSYSEGWFNPEAANALQSYWDQYTLIPPVDTVTPGVVPVIATITVSGAGNVQVAGTGPDGAAFRVLATSDLTQPRNGWDQIHTGSFTNGQFQFTAPDTTNHHHRFYLISTP
jgi:hypothetical protein